MANYKNSLQEKFQKIQLGLPKYNCKKTEVGWISTIELCNGAVFTGAELITKVGSDQDAARQALKYFEGHLAEFYTDGLLEEVVALSKWQNVEQASNIWIVVDLENVGSEKEMQKLQQLANRGFIVSGYASGNYRNADKIKKYIREPLLHIDASDLPEVADVRIVMDITQAMIQDTFELIFIISYDRFARAAAEIFNLDVQSNRYPKTKVLHCRTVDQVLTELKRSLQ
jgi:hypothetical protein